MPVSGRAGPKTELTNIKGRTALMFACEHGFQEAFLGASAAVFGTSMLQYVGLVAKFLLRVVTPVFRNVPTRQRKTTGGRLV